MEWVAKWIRGRRSSAALPKSESASAAPAASTIESDGGLAVMIEVLNAAGLEARPDGSGVSSMIGIRGGRRRGDAVDVPGVVCDLRIVADATTRSVSCRAVLPDAVPMERYAAVAEAAMRINRTTMSGSWELDPSSGTLSLRTWIHIGGRSLSSWAAERLLGELHVGSEGEAAELCALAYDDDAPSRARGET